MWPYWLSALGLMAGAGMGAYGLINPRWAAGLVRLRDAPERPGGFAEFRATYGGLFLASHGVALTFVVRALIAGAPVPEGGESVLWFAEVAGLTCGAMWIGTGMGRLLSILLDGTGTKFNQASVAFELGLGLAIAAPCAFH